MGAGTREKSKAMLGGSQMLTWFLTQFSDMYENKCFFFFFKFLGRTKQFSHRTYIQFLGTLGFLNSSHCLSKRRRYLWLGVN